MTDFLVDNSVWVRLALGDAAITQRLRQIERAPSDLIVTCAPQVLEFCHSARTSAEHHEYRELISMGFPLEHAPEECVVLDIQHALWSSGLVRAAGPVDILIAGYAIVNDATVLAADRDFEHIARVTSLRCEYIAPVDDARP